MKTKKSLLFAFVLLFFNSCTLILGSDQQKIRVAATHYVENQLAEGEKMHWGHIERKVVRDINGRGCKCAEVKYRVESTFGGMKHKTLYLIMSEHCDTVYDISEHNNIE